MTGQHGEPIGQPTLVQAEPVAVAEGVRALLVVAVTAGWFVIPDATINLVVSAVGFGLSVLMTFLARSKVTPVVPGPDGAYPITSVPPAQP